MESKKVEILRAYLKKQKEIYSKDRNRHKYFALWIKLSTAMLAAIATVLLGWQKSPEITLPQNFALVLNAAITVIAAYEVFFEPRKLWVRETFVFSKLKDIERDFEYELTSDTEINNETLDKFKSKIDAVLQQSLTEWLEDKKSGK